MHKVAQLLLLASISTVARAQEKCAICPPRNQCVFRVLAVGDSLTRGAVPTKSASHPYSIKMTEVLSSRLSSRAKVDVKTAGHDYMGTIQKGRDSSGRVLDLTLVPFTQQLLQQAQQAGQSYQYAVLLGGINDLGNANQSAAVIFPKLVQMYDMLLASGANVIAVRPWPNRFVTRTSDNERQRQLLNNLIKEYVDSTANRKRQPRVHLLDLPAEWFDFWSMPSSRITQMQDDLLHLTPYGYDMFGNIVAEKMLSLIQPGGCLCACSSSSSRGSSSVVGRRGLGSMLMLSNWRLPWPRSNRP